MSIEDDDLEIDAYTDRIAARAEAFSRILATIDFVKDDDAKKEALLMLKALRLSFKTLPVGDLSALPGGKSG